MLSNRQNLGLILGVLGVCVFAGSLPATRIAIADVDPYFLTAMRATLAGLGGLILLIWRCDPGHHATRHRSGRGCDPA